MRNALLRPIAALLVTLSAAVAACSAAGGHNFSATSAGGAGSGGGLSSSGSSQGLGGTGTFATVGSGSGAGGGPAMTYAYAHTNDTLFQFDPTAATLNVTQVGKFDCIGGSGQDSSMTDIAVNATGDLWAVSAHNAYHLAIQGSTVHCAAIIPLKSVKATFYALSFAPPGVIDPGETLVGGDTSGALWKIDTSTGPSMGTLTQHGSFGAVPANDGHGHSYPLDASYTGNTVGKAWELSGDIVFLDNNGSPLGFATVRDCKSPPSSSTCDETDTLIQINMDPVKGIGAAGTQDVTLGVRGAIEKRAGCTDSTNSTYGSMYGIAAWGGTIYGFSHKGYIVEISNTDGSACLVASTPSDSWAGAGVTTAAKVIPPSIN